MDPTPNLAPPLAEPPTAQPAGWSRVGWIGVLIGLCGIVLAACYLSIEMHPPEKPIEKPAKLTAQEEREETQRMGKLMLVLSQHGQAPRSPETKKGESPEKQERREQNHQLLATGLKLVAVLAEKPTPAPGSTKPLAPPAPAPAPAPVVAEAPDKTGDGFWIGKLVAGSLALGLGGWSRMRGENHRVAWFAIFTGIAALAFKYVIIVIGIMALSMAFVSSAPG